MCNRISEQRIEKKVNKNKKVNFKLKLFYIFFMCIKETCGSGKMRL
jgi:hypothetical protein